MDEPTTGLHRADVGMFEEAASGNRRQPAGLRDGQEIGVLVYRLDSGSPLCLGRPWVEAGEIGERRQPLSARPICSR
jgi:hypothetical protein